MFLPKPLGFNLETKREGVGEKVQTAKLHSSHSPAWQSIRVMIDSVHDMRYVVGESNFNVDDIGMGRESIAIGNLVTTQFGIAVVRYEYTLCWYSLFVHGIQDCE